MLSFNSLKSGTAALLAVTITGSAVAPIMLTAPAFAQSPYPSQGQNNRSAQYNFNFTLPSGTTIPVRYDKDKILVLPDETAKVTLKVAADVKNSDGRVVIPEGSELVGEIRPATRGSQFVANQVTLYRRQIDKQSQPFSISANSNVVTRTEEVKKGASTGTILTGAAVGAGAAAAISAITGDHSINTWAVLGSGAAGAVGGWLLGRKSVDMVAIRPNQGLECEIDIRLCPSLIVFNSEKDS